MIAFGPVPSRRLGRSLGINHLPPRVCTYSCVYCQVGRTTRLRDRRARFVSPDQVVAAVERKLVGARRADEPIDYLTFVPDGEPTLDRAIGELIRRVKPLGLPIAVVTNGSLLSRPDVREDLADADWVSVKVDTVAEGTWHALNRPHGRLRLEDILEGVQEFAAGFRGTLVTETMLVAGANDREAALRDTASFIRGLDPTTAYVAAPTRPPAESWVEPTPETTLTRAYEVFRALAGPTELLIGYEGDAFASTGDAREDILAITAVHPMRKPAVSRVLGRAGAHPGLVDEMLRRGELVTVRYGGHHYVTRPTGWRAGPGGRSEAS